MEHIDHYESTHYECDYRRISHAQKGRGMRSRNWTIVVSGFLILTLVLGCEEQNQTTYRSSSRSSAEFRLTDVRTGWSGGTRNCSTIQFDVENTGSIQISRLDLYFTFRSGGSDSQILGDDVYKCITNIPVGESRGVYEAKCYIGYDEYNWELQLAHLQNNRSRPPTVEVRASVNGGSYFTVDTYDIYVPN